jgi:hypothetical protein
MLPRSVSAAQVQPRRSRPLPRFRQLRGSTDPAGLAGELGVQQSFPNQKSQCRRDCPVVFFGEFAKRVGFFGFQTHVDPAGAITEGARSPRAALLRCSGYLFLGGILFCWGHWGHHFHLRLMTNKWLLETRMSKFLLALYGNKPCLTKEGLFSGGFRPKRTSFREIRKGLCAAYARGLVAGAFGHRGSAGRFPTRRDC